MRQLPLKRAKQALRVALAGLYFCLPVMAQGQAGYARGIVFDAQTKEPLPFANVVLSEIGRGVITDSNGYFFIGPVPAGKYMLIAGTVGYQDYQWKALSIPARDTVFLELPMRFAPSVLEAVTVQAAPFKHAIDAPISLRTLGATEIPVINHLVTQGASGGAFSILNANQLREVDYLSASFPANRGNALSSVFNFALKDGRRDRLGLTATLGGTEAGMALEGPIGANAGFLLSARRSYRQYILQLLDFAFLPIYNDLTAKVNIQLDPKKRDHFARCGRA
jgi:hypothetical protein